MTTYTEHTMLGPVELVVIGGVIVGAAVVIGGILGAVLRQTRRRS